MAAALDSQRLGAIFQARPDILDGIKRAAGASWPLIWFRPRSRPADLPLQTPRAELPSSTRLRATYTTSCTTRTNPPRSDGA